jgi:hypothetical protein
MREVGRVLSRFGRKERAELDGDEGVDLRSKFYIQESSVQFDACHEERE